MQKSKNFMEEVADIIRHGGHLHQFEEDCDMHVEVNGGESWDGFINFTDGYVDKHTSYVPIMDEHLTFKGFNKKTRHNAMNVQKVLDCLEGTDGMVCDFYDWNLDKDEYAEVKDKFNSREEFVNWYNDYVPNQYHYKQLSLFDGKPCATRITDPKLDKLYDDIQEFCSNYYTDSPAFIGVCCRLYDSDNRRNDNKDGKNLCVIESYFNDDLSYGRESVGAWAGTNCIGNHFGKQVIYTDEFAWNNLGDLKRKLSTRVKKAYESLGVA